MTAAEDASKPSGGGAPEGSQNVAKDIDVNPALNGAKRGATATANDPIASALRRLHDDVISEPIPNDFMLLLASIDEKREASAS